MKGQEKDESMKLGLLRQTRNFGTHLSSMIQYKYSRITVSENVPITCKTQPIFPVDSLPLDAPGGELWCIFSKPHIIAYSPANGTKQIPGWTTELILKFEYSCPIPFPKFQVLNSSIRVLHSVPRSHISIGSSFRLTDAAFQTQLHPKRLGPIRILTQASSSNHLALQWHSMKIPRHRGMTNHGFNGSVVWKDTKCFVKWKGRTLRTDSICMAWEHVFPISQIVWI